MTIKVFDFRTTGKLSANCYDALINSVTFVMMIDKDHSFKEFMVTIPKRYHFISLTKGSGYIVGKAREYDVLKDFIVNNKDMLCEKWGLNNIEYEELLEGLYECLIIEYGKASDFAKWCTLLPITLKRIVRRIFGGVRVC